MLCAENVSENEKSGKAEYSYFAPALWRLLLSPPPTPIAHLVLSTADLAFFAPHPVRIFRRSSIDAPRRGRRPRRPVARSFHASGGNIPRSRARVTFGRSPKSDQKVCLKPQVSRLPARLTMSKNMAAYPAKAKIYADRRTTNRLYVSPRCRSRVPRGDALVYRLCGGVLACRFTKCASQQRVFFYIPRPNRPHLHLLPAAASARFDNRLYR